MARSSSPSRFTAPLYPRAPALSRAEAGPNGAEAGPNGAEAGPGRAEAGPGRLAPDEADSCPGRHHPAAGGRGRQCSQLHAARRRRRRWRDSPPGRPGDPGGMPCPARRAVSRRAACRTGCRHHGGRSPGPVGDPYGRSRLLAGAGPLRRAGRLLHGVAAHRGRTGRADGGRIAVAAVHGQPGPALDEARFVLFSDSMLAAFRAALESLPGQ